MEYGPQILAQLAVLQKDSGESSAHIKVLQAEAERQRKESSDRHEALCAKLDNLSEVSQKRHESVEELRRIVAGCPQHHTDGAGIDVPESRLRKPDDSGSMRRARRGLLKSLAALFTAAATALAGWWATHKSN